MSDTRKRSRIIFESPENIKRAVRARAALDGVRPMAIINAALTTYLEEELDRVRGQGRAPRGPRPGARRQRPQGTDGRGGQDPG